MHYRQPNAPVGQLSAAWYVIPVVRSHACNICHLHVVTASIHAEINDDVIYMALPKG